MQVIYRGLLHGGYPIRIVYNREAQQSTQFIKVAACIMMQPKECDV